MSRRKPSAGATAFKRAVQGMDKDRLLLEEHVDFCAELLRQIAEGKLDLEDSPPEYVRRFTAMGAAVDDISWNERLGRAFQKHTVTVMLWITLDRLPLWLRRTEHRAYAQPIKDWQEAWGTDRASRVARKRFFQFLGLNDANGSYKDFKGLNGYGFVLMDYLLRDLCSDSSIAA